MDNVTHTLFALALARTPLGRAGRGTTAALVLASNAPDADIVTSVGGAITYLKWHRGPTHGPIGVVVLGLASAALAWAGLRYWDKRSPRERDAGVTASFAMLAAVSMIAVALHILMDLPTSYGVRFLSPFVWRWYTLDWIPIIDVYLLTTLIIGIVLSRRSDSARRRGALIILLFMAANYGVRAASHTYALEIAPRLFGPLLPPPCDGAPPTQGFLASWPRPVAAPATGRCLAEIAAIPTFASPFRWRVIAHLSDAYEIHDVDLLDRRFSEPASDRESFFRVSLRFPNRWTDPVVEASRTPLVQTFLGFSRFPAARSVVETDEFATVRVTDMRFVGGTVTLDQPTAPTNLFTAMVRIAPDGEILLQRLGR